MDRGFRLSGLTTIAAALLLVVYKLSPAQFPVVLHKLSLAVLAAVTGYWIDRHIFPYARPGSVRHPYKSMAMIRRAIIVAAVVVGVSIGV